MKKCSKCGASNTDDSRFCASCGNEFPKEPVRRFCPNCGKELEANARFCSKCGTEVRSGTNDVQNSESNYYDEAKPEQIVHVDNEKQEGPEQAEKSAVRKDSALRTKTSGAGERTPKQFKVNKKIAGIGLGVLALVLAVVIFGFARISGFKSFTSDFKTACEAYPSMGEYAEEYQDEISEAQSIIGGFRFWKTGSQKREMTAFSDKLKELNEKVAESREVYQEALDKFEKNDNYFLGTYEDAYNDSKSACEEAFDAFDVEGSDTASKEYSELVDEIIDYNKSEGKSMAQAVKTVSNYYYSCEETILEEKAETIKTAYSNKKFKEEKDAYDAYEAFVKIINNNNAANVINTYTQVDVSAKSAVDLYIRGISDNEQWDKDSFVIYEKSSGKKGQWDIREVSSITQVEGDTTIDLVADVSDSMSSSFYQMQSAVNQFVDGTDANTKLGLSTIGTVYQKISDFTDNKESIKTDVNNLVCDGVTSLYQSLYDSVLYTATEPGSKCVVAFTDGMNVPYGTGYDYDDEDVVNIANSYKIPVYIIGVGYDVDESTLRYIASSTGGEYRHISDISGLYDIYQEIYNIQNTTYKITYKSSLKGSTNRTVYVYGQDTTGQSIIHFQQNVDAELLTNAYYNTSLVNSGDLTSYFTNKKYLSEFDLQAITDVQDVQKIINIYCAKEGYQFGNKTVLNQMIQLGVISSNGTLSMTAVENKLKKDTTLFANYMSLYNYRYELLYNVGVKKFRSGISYADFKGEINTEIGEDYDSIRFDPSIKKIYQELNGD